MNIDFAFKALRKLVIFRYSWFEFTVSDKWHKSEEEEECKKTSSDQTTIQEMWRHQQKLHTQCVAFGESVLRSLTKAPWADVNKMMASECYSVPVLPCVCIIGNVSTHTLLTRWMTEKCPLTLFCFGWLVMHPQKVRSKIWKYRHRLFGVLAEVFCVRQVYQSAHSYWCKVDLQLHVSRNTFTFFFFWN